MTTGHASREIVLQPWNCPFKLIARSMIALFAALSCVFLHLLVLAGLGIRESQQSLPPHGQDGYRLRIPAMLIQFNGIVVAGVTLLLSVVVASDEPLEQCVVRVIAFFYAFKLLDLTLTKATKPPTLLKGHDTIELSRMWLEIARYVLLLFSEMRYQSFDIAVTQRQRPATAEQRQHIIFPVIAFIIMTNIDSMLPSPELKCICLLLLLQGGFEMLHSFLHQGCKHPLFYQPFSAASASSFWTTHWHAGAASFLQSLGYHPGKRLGGRWLGVLATFNLTGIWHGWASAALVQDDYAVVLGMLVWAFFMLQGFLCIAERLIWGSKQGGVLQRALVWAIPIAAAGQCFRRLQEHSIVPFLSA